jgi:hypothetical protein
MNEFGVGAVGKKVQINNIAPRHAMTPKQAIELAAWLVATAVPLRSGDAASELGAFLRLVESAADEDSPLAEAVRAELEE